MQPAIWGLVSGLLLSFANVHAQRPDASVLRTMLIDRDPEIRVKAAEGLGRVGGRQAVIILRQGLSDGNTECADCDCRGAWVHRRRACNDRIV